MRIRKISYVFVLCPALVVGMTSCGKTSGLPGRALTYGEALEYSKKIAPEYNMRTSLTKTADFNVGINKFTVDGKIRIPGTGSEPTNIRFTMPAQDDFRLTLNNETGVMGALEVRERLARDFNGNALSKVPAKFGGNFLYNAMFNPFFTTYTLSYLHTLVSTFDDLSIIKEDYSLDGKTFYVRYSIPDLKTFTEVVEEYELREITDIFTVFRGTDGNVALTMGFDKYGYLSNFNLKAKSKDLVVIAESETPDIETFHGYADIDFKAKIKQHFYEEDDYRTFIANDYSVSNGPTRLTTRAPSVTEYRSLGFSTRQLDASFIQDVLNYSDVILPGYGTDFIIEHKDKTSTLNNIKVNIDGIVYKASDLIPEKDVFFTQSWKANNAYGYQTDLIDEEYGATSGRVLIDGSNEEVTKLLDRSYYPVNGAYTLDVNGLKGAHSYSLLDEIINIDAGGHKYSPIEYYPNQNLPSQVKRQYISANPLEPWFDGGKRGLQVKFDPSQMIFKGDFYTEVSALPYGYAHYNFMQNDGTKYGSSDNTTRTSFATINGSSHGILDVIKGIAADGTYTSPVIKPAEGFIISKQIADESILKDRLKTMGFFKVANPSILGVDELINNVKLTPEDGSSWDNLTGFQFKVPAEIMKKAIEFSKDEGANPTHEGLFRLTDFVADGGTNIGNGVFIRGESDLSGPFYLDYEIIKGANLSDTAMYNTVNGLENGKIKFELKDNLATFNDVEIRADEGYAFPADDVSNLLKKMAAGNHYCWDPHNKNYSEQCSLDSLLTNLAKFAKLSDDKTKLTISVNNIPEADRDEAKAELYMCLQGLWETESTNYFKCLFSSIVESAQPMKFSAGDDDPTDNYLNIIPGKDFTYVQILPDYCNLIDKDLEFIFGF